MHIRNARSGAGRPSRALLAWATLAAIALLPADANAQVELKSRTVTASSATTREFVKALERTSAASAHGIATFSKHVTEDDREHLSKLGIHVLGPLQGTAYRVRVQKPVSLAALKSSPLRPRLAVLRPRDRLEPWLLLATKEMLSLTIRLHSDLTKSETEAFLAKYVKKLDRSREMRSDQTWLVYDFPRRELRELVREDAVLWINETPGKSTARPKSAGKTVAEVAPPPELSNPLGGRAARAVLNVDAVQKFDDKAGRPAGLGGDGVTIGVFDFGIDETHGDFSPARVIRNDAPMHPHATQMAGIIAGNGSMSRREDSCGFMNEKTEGSDGSTFQYRGMAPLAKLLDVDMMPEFGKNGANVATHIYYIKKHGMQVSNHSYTMNKDGTYDESNATRDQIIRGDGIRECVRKDLADPTKSDVWSIAAHCETAPARLHVTSGGNFSIGHFTLSKQLKNALVVGNWRSDKNEPSRFDSWGPTTDGRIKPDVVAPGFMITTSFCYGIPGKTCPGPFGPLCTGASGMIQRQNYYTPFGTEAGPNGSSSAASAATTGVVALLLQQYARSFGDAPATPLPLPSTLRGVMIHTARDPLAPAAKDGMPQKPKAPDFITGWGLVDAQAAVGIVERKTLIEGRIERTCQSLRYSFDMPKDAGGNVRVTLAWDDVPGDPALGDEAPKLVNDLDLVVTGPDGKTYLPWQADQEPVYAEGVHQCGKGVKVLRKLKRSAIPVKGTPPEYVVRPGRDHLNNVEVVDAPASQGKWQVEIIGFSVPQGPQRFSLIGPRFTEVPRN